MKNAIILAVILLLNPVCSYADVREDNNDDSGLYFYARHFAAYLNAYLSPTNSGKSLWISSAKNHQQNYGKVALANKPVDRRQRLSLPDIKVQPKEAQFSDGLSVGVRITQMPSEHNFRFEGVATVSGIRGDSLSLDIGRGQFIDIIARIDKEALPVFHDQRVDVYYDLTNDGQVKQEFFSLLSDNGVGIVSIDLSGDEPVELEIPNLNIIATQKGAPLNGKMPLHLSVNDIEFYPEEGEIIYLQKEGINVALIASNATIADKKIMTEGHPFSVKMLVWLSE